MKVIAVEDWNNDSRSELSYYYAKVIVTNSSRDLKGSAGMVDLNVDKLIIDEESPLFI